MPLLPNERFSSGSTTRPVSSTKPTGIRGILDEDFRPEFERLEGEQSDLESMFLEALRSPVDFESFRGELSAMAESLTNELFGAGGAVELATRDAAGRTVETGFGTASGGFDAARANIFGGARDEVANRVAQGALNLAPVAVQARAGDLGLLGAFTAGQAGRLDDLRESLFGGEVTIEQLGLARESQDLNRRLIEQALAQWDEGGFLDLLRRIGGGAAQGALAGSVVPGLGTTTGAIFGGITGLFS